jgi:hypothetical protein
MLLYGEAKAPQGPKTALGRGRPLAAGRLVTAYLKTACGQPQPFRSDASVDPLAQAAVSLWGERESTKCNHNGEHRHIGYL